MPLSRADVLNAALSLFDEEGLDAVSMRRVADKLSVQAGALYWHFKDKQALLDAMIDEIMAPMLKPPLRGTWQNQCVALMRRMRNVLSARPDTARLVMHALTPGENGLMISELMLRILRVDAGMSKPNALWASAVLSYYVLGFIIDTQVSRAAVKKGAHTLYAAMRPTLDPAKFPTLLSYSDAAMSEAITMRDHEARFAFGLRVIIKGLEATAVQKRTRKPAARARRS